jgi:hypothetical protein
MTCLPCLDWPLDCLDFAMLNLAFSSMPPAHGCRRSLRGNYYQDAQDTPPSRFSHFPISCPVAAGTHSRQTGPLALDLIWWLQVTRHRTPVSKGRTSQDNCPNRAAAE